MDSLEQLNDENTFGSDIQALIDGSLDDNTLDNVGMTANEKGINAISFYLRKYSEFQIHR
jgi:hypothetical protein